jgi:hypothetical protein
MSAVTPKAEVNSDKAHKSNQGYKRDNPIPHYICLIWSDANSTRVMGNPRWRESLAALK